MSVNYHEYIQSPAWAAKRQEFFASKHRNSKRCFVCWAPRAPGFHVHHATYNRLGNERVKDLVLVCPTHHEDIHRMHERRKRRQAKRGQQANLRTSTKKTRAKFERKARKVYGVKRGHKNIRRRPSR